MWIEWHRYHTPFEETSEAIAKVTRQFYGAKAIGIRIILSVKQEVSVNLKEAMSVEEFLASACLKKGLSPQEHFVRIKKRRDMDDNNSFIPHRSDLIDSYLATHEVVEICAKIIYQVDLSRNSLTQMWGFSVEAELVENSEKQDELCCYISRAEEGSLAMSNGLMKGDEILVINGAVVGDLDMMYLEALLQEERTLSLVIRSARRGPPNNGRLRSSDYIMSLVCPPPPSEPPTLSEEAICGLIVPAPTEKSNELTGIGCPPPPVDGRRLTQRSSSLEIENLLKNTWIVERQSAEQVTGICRKDEGLEGGSSLLVGGDLSPTTSLASSSFSHSLTPQRQLSDAVRLRKVILELLETEKTYVSHLNSLLENYLEPLKRETFLSATEITGLFGNILEIVMFQRLFARGMEEAIHVDGDIFAFDQPPQFKNVLFALGNAFLFHSKNFKLYSSFCASHSKAQKILHPHEGNQALQRFLRLRNPRGQHSMSLESYLIKPIQRILQYPLLLTQLQQLTPVGSEEHQHLGEALREMEGVAEHINEMQRIHEEYGAIFDHLCRQHLKNYKQEMDLSPGELLYYGGVEWLNIGEFLGRGKKGLEFHSMCFVFCTAVVFLCKERLRQKKKLMGPPSRMPGGVNSEVEVIRYQVLIPVNQVQVRCPNVKEVEARFYWELIHLRGGGNSSQPNNVQRRNEKAYHLCNSTSEFRNAFIKTIRQIIRESVRNMSIPSNKAELIRGSKEHRDAMLSRTLSTRASSTSGERREKSHSNGERRDSRGSQTRSQTLSTRGSRESPNFRARSMTEGTAGRKPDFKEHSDKKIKDVELTLEPTSSLDYSEGEGSGEKPALGKTPKHLSLSSTSTLSISSSAGLGQAKLIHSSGTPGNQNNEGSSKPMGKERDRAEGVRHQCPVGQAAPDLGGQPSFSMLSSTAGSPVWKPRDPTVEAFPLPPGKDS
ncbi:unnamed protein product [Darwinula stevensoni]|uniref:Uncharacterized protein n=1 Tax=Darwinula stevensoni TaxID=69355 RepID=A0A7R8XER6_9CRUS|nr:unnamed protein product [Darwinula stevensoni]CAG0889931.1 unnamed protein product [Darwinula stevensoni]